MSYRFGARRSSSRVYQTTAAAALLAAGMLAVPLVPARAQQASTSAETSSDAATHAESVDQRIAKLKTSLKITAAEEADWDKVAQVMRDNAASMEKLAAQTHSQTGPKTAPDDLKTYAAFAQAHVDGLNKLMTSFDALYATMPDTQKKLADQVFEDSGHEHGPAHS